MGVVIWGSSDYVSSAGYPYSVGSKLDGTIDVVQVFRRLMVFQPCAPIAVW